MSHHSLLRDPALESEYQPHKRGDQQSAGHLVMPDGSLISSTDYAFLTACAPHVLALHRQAKSSPGAASRERRYMPEAVVDSRARARSAS